MNRTETRLLPADRGNFPWLWWIGCMAKETF